MGRDLVGHSLDVASVCGAPLKWISGTWESTKQPHKASVNGANTLVLGEKWSNGKNDLEEEEPN